MPAALEMAVNFLKRDDLFTFLSGSTLGISLEMFSLTLTVL